MMWIQIEMLARRRSFGTRNGRSRVRFSYRMSGCRAPSFTHHHNVSPCGVRHAGCYYGVQRSSVGDGRRSTTERTSGREGESTITRPLFCPSGERYPDAPFARHFGVRPSHFNAFVVGGDVGGCLRPRSSVVGNTEKRASASRTRREPGCESLLRRVGHTGTVRVSSERCNAAGRATSGRVRCSFHRPPLTRSCGRMNTDRRAPRPRARLWLWFMGQFYAEAFIRWREGDPIILCISMTAEDQTRYQNCNPTGEVIRPHTPSTGEHRTSDSDGTGEPPNPRTLRDESLAEPRPLRCLLAHPSVERGCLPDD